jgi:major membrane immunogen (membrane-anchored lipoprotein)
MAEAINIRLFEEDHGESFVEIETDDGKSVSIGERIKNKDGYTRIRITLDDIREA